MTVPDYLDPRLTEQRNPRTERIDVASTLEIVDLLNAEDARVAGAVRAVRGELARAIDLVVSAFGRGGRLIYIGAGTSGRLGVLDASECPPTFGTPPEMVVGVIAGGYPALVKSSEGAEDDVNAGMAAMDQAGVTPADFVLGIAASGTTPFVRAALSRAQTIGAATGLVSCSDPPRVLVETCDVLVLPKVGHEARRRLDGAGAAHRAAPRRAARGVPPGSLHDAGARADHRGDRPWRLERLGSAARCPGRALRGSGAAAAGPGEGRAPGLVLHRVAWTDHLARAGPRHTAAGRSRGDRRAGGSAGGERLPLA